MEFFRQGEAAAFEKREARQEYSMYEGISRFSITESVQVGGMGDYQTLMMKITDPKLSPAEREQIMKQLEKASEQMQVEMKKMSDPAYMKGIEEQKKKFGCERMELRMQGGRVTGEMRCAPAVGARLALTGSLKFLGR